MMLTRLALATALLSASACKFPYPADVPDDDADAGGDARSCTPNTITCTNGNVTACGPDGVIVSYAVPNGGSNGEPTTVTLDDYPCPLGCAVGRAGCADVSPSNGLGPALDGASASLSGPDVVVDDTSAPASMSTSAALQNGSAFIVQGGGTGQQLAVPAVVVTQVGGPEILVLTVRSFALKPGVRLIVGGLRPIAIVSALDIYIGGTLDASGNILGPGALRDTMCNVPPNFGALGGGGNYENGGASSSGGLGGMSLEATAPNLIPLVGGCGGGQSSSRGGGGAVQLVSRTRVAVGPSGIIDVSGLNGIALVSNGQLAVSGGASGGGLLIEAPTIALAPGSRLLGRGGSGAAGNTTDNTFANGLAGDADLSASTVPGARCAGCGIGGAGGTEIAPPGSGQGGGTMLAGGGGSVGRCVLANRSGVVIPPSGTLMLRRHNAQVGIR